MIMKILKLEWERCRWHLLLQEGVLGGQPWQYLGYEPKENLDKARPKDMANLVTSSCEMPKTANLSYQLHCSPGDLVVSMLHEPNNHEVAAIWVTRPTHARGSCHMYTWYAWLFHLPDNFICHWESPACVVEVAPPIWRLWPEYLDELSPSCVAMSLICLTKVKWSRALLSICRKGVSREVCAHWCCWMMHQALHAPHTGVLVHPMMTGQPRWKGSVLLLKSMMHT